jgi:hypothetical protein
MKKNSYSTSANVAMKTNCFCASCLTLFCDGYTDEVGSKKTGVERCIPLENTSSVTEEYQDGENSYCEFFGLIPFLQLAIQMCSLRVFLLFCFGSLVL